VVVWRIYLVPFAGVVKSYIGYTTAPAEELTLVAAPANVTRTDTVAPALFLNSRSLLFPTPGAGLAVIVNFLTRTFSGTKFAF